MDKQYVHTAYASYSNELIFFIHAWSSYTCGFYLGTVHGPGVDSTGRLIMYLRYGSYLATRSPERNPRTTHSFKPSPFEVPAAHPGNPWRVFFGCVRPTNVSCPWSGVGEDCKFGEK